MHSPRYCPNTASSMRLYDIQFLLTVIIRKFLFKRFSRSKLAAKTLLIQSTYTTLLIEGPEDL